MLLSQKGSYIIIFQLGRNKQYFQSSILMTDNTKLKSNHIDISRCTVDDKNGKIKQAS